MLQQAVYIIFDIHQVGIILNMKHLHFSLLRQTELLTCVACHFTTHLPGLQYEYPDVSPRKGLKLL